MTRSIALATALIALAGAAPALAQQATNPASVTLTFETGAETGRVMVSLYDSEAAWSGGPPVASAMVDVAAGQHSATFEGLASGNYGMRAFHDVDADGAMDTNPFGMPTEPYAFSNNARGNMGPARWEQAQFAVSGPTAQTIVIK